MVAHFRMKPLARRCGTAGGCTLFEPGQGPACIQTIFKHWNEQKHVPFVHYPMIIWLAQALFLIFPGDPQEKRPESWMP
jgi:hypothetical protein